MGDGDIASGVRPRRQRGLRVGRWDQSLEATPVQQKFLTALGMPFEPGPQFTRYRHLAIGGGIRGTKTFAMLMAFVILCRYFPRSRWAIVRRDLPTIKRNTLPSFEAVRATCRAFVGPINQSTWTATCANGSQIIFFPEQAERDPDYNRWRGLAVNGFGLDEGNELEEASKDKAIERAGAHIIMPTEDDPHPRQPPPLILVSFNPCNNWPRDMFYEPFMHGKLGKEGRDAHGDLAVRFYQPATIDDNPFVSDQYIESLKDLPPALYNRFVKGDWAIADAPDQLISLQWLEQASDVPFIEGPDREAMDVARKGDDWTVFARMRGNALVELKGYYGLKITEGARTAMRRIATDRLDPDDYWVDSVGMGAGTYDIMYEHGYHVREFVAGASALVRRLADAKESPTAKYTLKEMGERIPRSVVRFRNLRTQAWWEVAQKLRRGEIRISREMWQTDEGKILRRDLLAMTYDHDKGDKVLTVLSKDEFKEDYHRSSDYGDAFVMANFDPADGPRIWTVDDFAGAMLRR